MIKKNTTSYTLQLIQSFPAKAYTVNCPAGLHYNPSIEKCDWPENTECVAEQNGENHII